MYIDISNMLDADRITDQWLAGFFDGEGTICGTFRVEPSEGKLPKMPRIYIGISQKNLPLLSMIKEKFGGTLRPQYTNGDISCYNLQWYGRSALPILNAILPYLVIKRSRAEIGIRFLSSVGSGAISNKITGRKMPLPDEVLSDRIEMVLSLRALNRRNLSSRKLDAFNAAIGTIITAQGPVADVY